MIISEDHILQAELNNLTLAHAYPLHLIIKNKKGLDPQPRLFVIPMNTTYGNQHSPYYTSFLRHGQTTQPSYTEIGTLLPTTPHSPPFGHPHLYQSTKSSSIYNHLVHSAQTFGSSQQDS